MKINIIYAVSEIFLVFLNFEVFKCGPANTKEELEGLVETYPFLSYASDYWATHLSEVPEEACHDLDSLALQFIASDEQRNLITQLRIAQLRYYPKDSEDPSISDPCSRLHLLSMYNIVRLAETFLDVVAHVNNFDAFGAMTIDHALPFNNREMALW